MTHCLYLCKTVHTRLHPFRRRFSQRLCYLYLDIDALADLRLRLLQCDKPGALSFDARDHGDRSGGPLRPWVERALAQAGVDLGGGAIHLLTLPRVFGYVFNPLSIYFGYGPDKRLRGVVYEVNNTFGQTHAYAAAIAPSGRLAEHAAPKRFFVSPFLDVRGHYRFRLRAPGERLSVAIDNIVDGARVHGAVLAGERRPLSDWALAKMLIGTPLMTLQVIAAIHWHALFIWLRGARYRRRPPQPPAAATAAT